MKMGAMGWITTILVVIGGINWGLMGFFNFNLVESIFGMGTLTSIIYDLVGLSTLWMIYAMSKM